MTLSDTCAVCASTDLRPFIVAKDYPVYLVPLPRDLAAGVLREDLPVLACGRCGHMQAAEPDAATQKAIYATYYSHYKVDSAEALLPHYREPFHHFVSQILAAEPAVAAERSVLEIGCSSGANVGFFTRFAGRYVGVDASERIKLAHEAHPQHRFMAGYFPDVLPEGQFDVIISQFNLEHIGDISRFLSACADKAAPGGKLIVQVPDIDEFARGGQPNFLAHEHLQYFRKDQLGLALRRHGWAPVAWGEPGASLICAATRIAGETAQAGAVAAPLEAIRNFAVRFNAKPDISDEPSILYGVGPQLFWLLQHLKPATVRHVLDDNPAYAGQFVPGSSWPVEVLNEAMLAETPHLILSLNSIYHERVIARIKAFGVSARITRCRQARWETVAL